MSCRRQLPRHLSTVTTRLWKMDSHTGHHGSVFPQHHMGVSGSGGPGSLTTGNNPGGGNKKNSSTAISVTFTMALCKNVKRRLRKANVELPIVNEMDKFETTGFAANTATSGLDQHSASPEMETGAGVTGDARHENLELYFHRYLSEICIKTEPLDFVFKPQLMSLISGLAASHAHSSSSASFTSNQTKPKVNDLLGSPGLSRSAGKAKTKRGSQETLATFPSMPLIYADLGVIRVFLPKSPNGFGSRVASGPPQGSAASCADGLDLSGSTVIDIEDDTQSQDTKSSNAQAGKEMESHIKGPESEVCSTLNHTMLVVQVNGCVVQPHADNPLPR